MSDQAKHPAKFSSPIMDHFTEVLHRWEPDLPETELNPGGISILDPMAGVGKIHQLAGGSWRTFGVELEEEWASQHEKTLKGDARDLPWLDGSFSAVVTSPSYGNRMADQYLGEKGAEPGKRSKRNTYAFALGRRLTDGSGAALQWGTGYRDLHSLIMAEMVRVLHPGGILVLNMSDHIRQGSRQYVTSWWFEEARHRGLFFVEGQRIETRRQKQGANRDLRVDGEQVLVFVKEE